MLLNEKHWAWKGDNAGYSSIHDWIDRRKGKASFCTFNKAHKSTKFEWASLSHGFKRDVNDYISLCPSCHRKYDYTDEHRKNLSLAHMGHKPSMETRKKMGESRKRKVAMYDLKGKFIKMFSSTKEAAREMGCLASNISLVTTGRRFSAKGYKWQRLEKI